MTIQETELSSVFFYNVAQANILRLGQMDEVYALGKFTIPDNRNLVVELFEKSSGRQHFFVVTNSDILKARKLK